MLTINDLNIQFGDKHLFRQVNARLDGQERIGLVGVNGTGKSTLIKIMVGRIETDPGVVTRAKRTTIGYLPQEVDSFPPGRTLIEEAKTAFADALTLQQQLDACNHHLGVIDPADPEFNELLEYQGELQERLEHLDVFRIQSQTEKILLGLGFKNSDFDKECQLFSGGWLMRLMLAKILLAEPSLLLLDEPTNHLDIESLTWLEDFLKNYPGAMVIISHDRTFLDALTNITWELSLGRLTAYKGNYSKYVTDKEVRLEVQRAAYDNQQAKIQQTMRFVERFRSKSTKAKQAQSRLKQLEKMELIELEDTEKAINFHFPPAAPSGRLAVAVSHLAKSFDGKQIFTDLSFELQRGDKLAVVGVNGAGKSTLVKTLAGLNRQDGGEYRFGHNVIPSYFGQHQAQELDQSLSVFDTLQQNTKDMPTTQIRSLLGAFLFRGDEVDKKVTVLSGGEKSRLALAKMIAQPANLLIMDEPTNHLDMNSQEILQEAMRQYDGSIIVVSHNRYFLDSFVNKVLEIKDGRGNLFEGNISEYLHKVKQLRGEAPPAGGSTTETKPQASTQPQPATTAKGKEGRQMKAQLRAERNKKLGPLKKQVTAAEADIEKLEGRKGELERQLADPELYKDQDAFADRSREYHEVERRLKRAYQEWERLQEKMETLESELADND
ncbi:MAG: ABC-F family ATP-binding cassette domain-containing protein [Desulfobulbaceae bacterium]|nr:ABC-F family ATP-binding cassette domain-containing protein [Desulfobulbaceae bacterium]